MSNESSDVDIDVAVEKLKKKYLDRRKRVNTYVDCKQLISRDGPTGVNDPNVKIISWDVTLPSNLARASASDVTETTAPTEKKQKGPTAHGDSRSSTDISQVYQEMVHIYDKLHTERIHQQQWSVQLQEWEDQLQQREALVPQPQHALLKIQGVEEEVHYHIREMQERHRQEIKKLNDIIKEKTKENKRIKASFDSIKELNDTMRNQLSEVTEENRKLENQSKKVQARLENLQRKYGYSSVQKGRENVPPKAHESKPSRQDKFSVPSKSNKVSTNPSAVKLLVLLLDWVADSHLVPAREDDGWGAREQHVTLQEKCSKVLPMLTEQLQLVPAVDTGLLVPLLKFIYWSLRQLDSSPQHTTLTSTMRRLGEEVYRGTVQQGSALDPSASVRTKASSLFKSPSLHIRFLSTLIILKTITQADILAQALDSLHDDLRSEDGRSLFLQYSALPVVLGHLRGGNRGLLGPSVDILLQMTGESRLLNSFLEACSTEEFFRSISLLLRNPRIDVTQVEKISILLQKLSKIRKNKRLFELFTIHLMVQEMHRTVDPAHAFLAVNLNSILFNLGMIKKPSLCLNPADSP
ncbi:coiled-coil domain-containing protein 138-like [Megalops cyprinoides]|uniref:coiled-coil domain-containing protein 138-like n=1 Tax=Megalops cyprinoides TaxID=118141 RepID=UPI0018649665|nr:coiled-coil domain-containing protein 138-like [Megalops cyprinoides]